MDRTQCPFRCTSRIFHPRCWLGTLMYTLSWLGQNSKQNKLNRQLMDIQARMRLKVSSDKQELRQSYIPALFPYIVKPLMDDGVVRISCHILFISRLSVTRRAPSTLSLIEWTTTSSIGMTGTHSSNSAWMSTTTASS